MSRASDDVCRLHGALIVGAGIAGLFTALKLAPFPASVLALTPPGTGGASVWAQGGIAAAVGPNDSWTSHANDTLTAGAGTGEAEIARLVARDASSRIEDLIRYGVPFDRDSFGNLALAREAAHASPRIVHVSGDRAGAEVMRALAHAVRTTRSISLLEDMHAVELATNAGAVFGVFARHRSDAGAKTVLFCADAIVLASGGIGALYAVSTNPPDARGEGLGMAARAGAVVADPEFVQFHPTAINIGHDPAPLATEALRGEGAVLIDERGRRFMSGVHPGGELAPRDVVARAIYREMARGRSVYLDCRAAIGERFASRFPTVHAACQSAGIDPAREPIPVAPAVHYHMGGVAADHRGRSSLPGLWCVGECACTGLHGANRLASNSLLEALVFGARIAEDVRNVDVATNCSAEFSAPQWRDSDAAAPAVLRHSMTRWAGLERDAAGLKKALITIAALETEHATNPSLLNSLAAAKLIAAGALARRESLGAHFRRDYPLREHSPRRSFLTLSDAENVANEAGGAETGPRAASQ
jgi:L-aspartate oxidase